MPKKYEIPLFLANLLTQETYDTWLRRKAQAHVKRDRKRGNSEATGKIYSTAIHSAVIESQGKDAYTGEILNWKLISQYDNKSSKKGGRSYRHKFALLPTVDHVGDGMGAPDFKICSWRTNDSKNDLSLNEFTDLCKKVLRRQGYSIVDIEKKNRRIK